MPFHHICVMVSDLDRSLPFYQDLANHGFLDQYPELFADDIVEFLNR